MDGAWPDAVAILRQGNMHCSGVVIAPNWVLTAGHCSNRSETVRVGSLYSEEGGTTVGISETIEYPDDADVFDIQLHRLESPVQDPTHAPALGCVADHGIQNGATATLVGFGSTSAAGGFASPILLQADVPIVDADCLSFDKDCHPEAAPHGEFIAGGDGVDTCDGDSGGPVYGRVGGQTYILGVTSRAVRPSKNDCGDGGIYVQMDAIIPWIEAQSGFVFQRPDCTALGLKERPRPQNIIIESAFGKTVRGHIEFENGVFSKNYSYEVITPPAHGDIEFKRNGKYIYTPLEYDPSDERPQTDEWWVSVTDLSAPRLTGIATFNVTFVEQPSMCAVSSNYTVWWGVFVLPMLLNSRKKQG